MKDPERMLQDPSTVLQTDAVHALIDAAKAGDDRATRTLVGEAMAFIHPSIMQMLHQRRGARSYISETMMTEGPTLHRVIEEDAWDLTHATCVAMLNNLSSFKGRNVFGRSVRFSTWLYAIAQNQVRAALRKRWRERRRRHDSLADHDTVNGVTMFDHAADITQASPEEALIEQAELDLIKQALNEAPLTVEQRDAVVMFVVMGYRQERIAELTGVQIGTVKKRVFDGLRKLRTYVQEAEGERFAVGGTHGE